MKQTILWALLAALTTSAVAARAHDTWVQTNTNVIRAGDAVHIDLMLGNHGNEHRDFKLANKVDITASTLTVIDPAGKRYDIKDRLIDTGYTPDEGFWTAAFPATKPGMYMVAHTFDKVMSYAPIRSIKCAKTFFLVSKSLDRVSPNVPGFKRVLGAPLELVPMANTVAPMGPGDAIRVQLLFRGKPLAGAKVSFIPQGANLVGDLDARYERKTDRSGYATFEPKSAAYYLVAAHAKEPSEGGKDSSGATYTATEYSATLTVFVPLICSCCGG